jgi:hypothetical protein
VSHKLVVEFETAEDLQAFVNETAKDAFIYVDTNGWPEDAARIAVVGVMPYKEDNVTNIATGNIQNGIQCGDIKGGVVFGASNNDISNRWYPR